MQNKYSWMRSRSRPVLNSFRLESEEPESPSAELLKAGVGAEVTQY